MDTFVVRVRESDQSEPSLRGVVDEVASGTRSTFHNAEELMMILTRSVIQAATTDGDKKSGGSNPRTPRDGTRGLRLVSIAVIGMIMAMLTAFGTLSVSVASADEPPGNLPVWSTGTELSLPQDATTDVTRQDSGETIDCTGAGNCVTVGEYEDTDFSLEPMVDSETGGVWQTTPTRVTLPANANTIIGHQYAELAAVSCTSQGNCVAVGTYVANDSNSDHRPMVVAETNGVWGAAQEITQPADATPDDEANFGILETVTCTSPGNCQAGGDYVDTIFSTQAMVDVETNGVWSAATKLTLPADADTHSNGGSLDSTDEQYAAVDSISCPSIGTCVLVGFYTDTADDYQAMAATQTGPVTWGTATQVSNSVGAPIAFLGHVSCVIPNNCVAVGGFASPASVDYMYATAEINGTWGTGVEVSPPAAAIASDYLGSADYLSGLSCTSNLDCVAVGYATTAGDNRVAVTANDVDGAWTPSTQLTVPANATAPASPGTQWSMAGTVDCTSPGLCVATGSYGDATDAFQPVLFTSLPQSITPVSITITTLPNAVLGVPYTATLAATGGADHYTWSLPTGSLPAGLTVNSATGVISGTPTKIGTTEFSVNVTDSGPPSQQASGKLSITVNADTIAGHLTPHPIAGKVKITGKGLTIIISCSADTTQKCGGSLVLATTEHLKKPKKKTRTVTLGTAHYSIAGDAKKAVRVNLNATGKKLLVKHHKLSTTLTLTTTGVKRPVATKSVTLKLLKNKAKPKKHQ